MKVAVALIERENPTWDDLARSGESELLHSRGSRASVGMTRNIKVRNSSSYLAFRSFSYSVIPRDDARCGRGVEGPALTPLGEKYHCADDPNEARLLTVPHGEQRSYVYILASKSRVLYTGVTSRLEVRIREHKLGMFDGFATQYRVDRLVYYESFPNIIPAIQREKQIKRWRREKKVALVERDNPTWDDLAEEWGKQVPPLARKPLLGRNDDM